MQFLGTDTSRRLALYRDGADMTSWLPDSHALPGGLVAVPASLRNLQVLADRGAPTLRPMDFNYDWPIRPGRTVRAHQKTMSNFMVLNRRCFNLSDMGTMKTLAALHAADYVMSHENCKTLVVCPLSGMKDTWDNTVFLDFAGRRRSVIVHGSAAKRRELLAQDADFYIVNIDGVQTIAGELAQREDIGVVIVDECSAYRDHTTKRHKVARAVFKRRYLWLMTGTPCAQSPLNAYGQARLVNAAHGESWASFRSRVMTQVTKFKWVARQGALDAAYRLLTPSIRFEMRDCVDVPPSIVTQREVPLTEAQQAAYDQLKKELVLDFGSGRTLTAVNEAVLRGKLIQIGAGVVYVGTGATRREELVDATPRMEIVEEIIGQCAENVIVFAPLTNVLSMLYNRLHEKFSCAIINGATPRKRREAVFAGFQNGAGPKVILADPQTMAHSVTLTAASTIIWYAPTDKAELYLQANRRIDRPGQTKTTNIVQIASTPVEREIYRRIETNTTMQGLLLDMVKGG